MDRDAALRGDRFDTMRALARFVEDGTRYALAEANDRLQYARNGNERNYLSDLRNFAQRSSNLTNRLYDYQNNPRALDREVRNMINDARKIDQRMRRVNAATGVYDDWAAVRDGLDRMQRFVSGYDVQVPVTRPQWADRGRYDRYGRYGRTSDAGGYRTGVLTGRELSDFRAMASDVDQRLRRVVDAASRSYNAGPSRDLISDTRNLAYQASTLYERTRGGSLDVRDSGAIVDRMLADIERMDKSGLRGTVDVNTWNDWQSAVATLHRMDDMMRR